jgi:hypothetical protein
MSSFVSKVRLVAPYAWFAFAVALGISCLLVMSAILFVGGEPPQVLAREITAEEIGNLKSYSSGLRLFNEAQLDEARAAFDQARNTGSPILVSAAISASERTQHLLRLPPFLRRPTLLFIRQPASLQWIIVGIAAIIAFLLFRRSISRLFLKPGCDIGRLFISTEGGSVSEAAVQQLLQDRLRHIGFRFQRPGGAGGAIGPALAVGTLLPSANDTSPQKEVLAGLGEVTAKGGAAFAISQAARFVQLTRRNRRYRVEGFLRIDHESEVSSWIKLSDVRTGREITRVTATSAEAALYEGALNTVRVQSGDLLIRVIDLLAFKVWHSLSEGARLSLRPKSWLTLAHFVAALDSLAEVEAGTTNFLAAEQAFRGFDVIVNTCDPTYLPARFFRGFTRLLVGRLDECSTEMEVLSQQVEASAQTYARVLAAQWSATPPRWRILRPLIVAHHRLSNAGLLGKFIARPLNKVRAALDWWTDIERQLIGGDLYRCALEWEEFKETEREREWIFKTDVGRQRIETSLNILKKEPDLCSAFEHVLEAYKKGERAEEDRSWLDQVLDINRMRRFDNRLKIIDALLIVASVTGLDTPWTSSRPTGEDDKLKKSVAMLREGILGNRYRPGIDALERNIREKKFDEVRELLHKFREEVQVANAQGAAFSLMYQSNPLLVSLLLKMIIPDLSKTQLQRSLIIGDRFFLESKYYHLFARYQTLRLSELIVVKDASEDHFLRGYFLDVRISKEEPSYEIICLLKCLFATTLARLSLMGETDMFGADEIHPVLFSKDDVTKDIVEVSKKAKEIADRAYAFISNSTTELRPLLTEWRTNGTARMRAATASLLAHLARLHWKHTKEHRFPDEIREDEADPGQLLKEALAYEPSAIRFIEMAEYVASQGDNEEAERLLRSAQRLAPRHPVVREWLSSA